MALGFNVLVVLRPRQIERQRKWRAGWCRLTMSCWRGGTPPRERATPRDTTYVSGQQAPHSSSINILFVSLQKTFYGEVATYASFFPPCVPNVHNTRVASPNVISPSLGVAHLSGVLQWAAASHHAFADRNETKPETDRGAANTQRGLGRPHCKGADTCLLLFFFLFNVICTKIHLCVCVF